MGAILPLIIQLISGAAGGNALGKIMKNFDMGPLMNSAAGAVGGLGGGALTGMLGLGAAATTGDAAGGMDIGGIIAQVVGGGAGGGILVVLVGFIKNMMGNKGE